MSRLLCYFVFFFWPLTSELGEECPINDSRCFFGNRMFYSSCCRLPRRMLLFYQKRNVVLILVVIVA